MELVDISQFVYFVKCAAEEDKLPRDRGATFGLFIDGLKTSLAGGICG